MVIICSHSCQWIKCEAVLYIEGKIEQVFDQIKVINGVLITGTVIALV